MNAGDLLLAAVAAGAVGLLLAPSLALAGLALASIGGTARARPAGSARRIAVLIAAHDEERSVASTVASVLGSAPDSVVVHVVADNCRDATAAVARRAGACVHTRSDATRPGKAAALNWLTPRALAELPSADAVVVLDADARLEPGFFAALVRGLGTGAQVVQAANLIQTTSAPLTRLRDLAFHMRCELRPRAYERLGISVGLHGNGMCFTRNVLEQFAWNERSVGEDIEMHMRLVSAGVRVRFAPDAVVRSTMPERFSGAAGQATRWERGKLDQIRAGARLLWSGVKQRRISMVAVGYDVMIPPLSFLVAASAGVTLAGTATGDTGLAVIGATALAATSLHVARGLALAQVPARDLGRMALWAFPYVAWKVGIVASALAGGGRRRWAQARTFTPALARAREAEPE